MKPLEMCTCEACGQVIVKTPRDGLQRHLMTIERIYGYTLKDLSKQSKVRPLVIARNHFWLLMCIEEEWSYPRAGAKTKHTHTTVMHGVRETAHEFLGISKKAKLPEIVKAYWLAVGMTEEYAQERANRRAYNVSVDGS